MFCKSILTVAVAAAFAHTGPVAAQGKDSALMFEEILVTARKRTESVQDVPLSIDVVFISCLLLTERFLSRTSA